MIAYISQSIANEFSSKSVHYPCLIILQEQVLFRRLETNLSIINQDMLDNVVLTSTYIHAKLKISIFALCNVMYEFKEKL